MNKYNSSDFFKMAGIKASIDIETYERDMKEKDKELDKYKNIAEEIQTELFDIKDMIYKPETREENIPIQRKISEVIKKLEKLKGE